MEAEIFPRIDDPGLVGLQDFDVVGKIFTLNGEINYSKSELLQYWFAQSRGESLCDVYEEQHHQLNCVVKVRIGSALYVLLYHNVESNDAPPSYAMPYVLMLYASGRLPDATSSVSVFCESEDQYASDKECLRFLVQKVVANGNYWSLASLARDFKIESADLATSGYGLLLSDAFSAGKIKYAYLDLFRCIEHRALKYAQEQFSASFLNDPRGAADEIVATIKSEKKLYGRVINSNASVIAGASEVIESVRLTNLYLTAVINRIDGLPADANEKSTHILYAVRNSIAHAKAGDLMVERFPDYEFALARIVPYVEILALRFAGIELDAALA